MKKILFILILAWNAAGWSQSKTADVDLNMKAKEAFYRNDYNKAIEIYNNLLKKYPQSQYIPEAHFWLGYSYMELQKPQEAYNHFQTLVVTFPNSRWADDGQVKIIELAKDLPDKSWNTYEQYISKGLYKKDIEIRYRAVIALSETGNKMILPDLIETIKIEKDPTIRYRLVSGLMYYTSPDIVPVVIDIYKTETELSVKRQLVRTLEPIHDPSVPDAIEKILLTEPHPMLRMQALDILEGLNSDKITNILVRGYKKEPDESLRFRYVQILSARAPENETSIFLDMMQKENSEFIRMTLTEDLKGKITTTHLPTIKKIILSEPRAEIRLGLLQIIASIDSDEITPVFTYALQKEKDKFVRNRALLSLESMREPIIYHIVNNIFPIYENRDQKLLLLHYVEDAPAHLVIPVIQMALSDGDENVKIYALGVLETIPQPDVSILRKAINDPSRKVRLRALPLLRSLQAEQEISLLKDLLRSEKDTGLLLQAVRQASNLDRTLCTPVLKNVVAGDYDSRARILALQLLSNKNPESALEQARKILANEKINQLLFAAIKMVADYKDIKSVNYLTNIIQSDRDDVIRKAAFQSLYFIDKSQAENLHSKISNQYY